MLIAEQLMEDMKASMRAADARRTGVVRLLRAAIKYEEIKLGHELNNDEVLKVLQHEAKQRRDSIEQYTQGSRQDLADQEQYELEIIGSYLPKPLSEDELKTLVEQAVTDAGATSPAQMGQIIGVVMKMAGARADGGAVSRLVKERLSA
jgi:uncharacterized protein YqeY